MEPGTASTPFRRDFVLYETSRAFLVIGLNMMTVAVGLQLYDATGKVLHLGLVGLAQFGPGMLTALPAGQAADWFDRRRILVGCNLLFAAAALLLLLQSRSAAPSLLLIYAAQVVIGVTRSFNAPAAQALLPGLVQAGQFGRAMGAHMSVFQISAFIGPFLGGAVYEWGRGAAAAYAAALAAFALGAVCLSTLRVGSRNDGGGDISRDSILMGIRYVWDRKEILGAVSLDLFAVLLGGATALLPVYAKDILHVGGAHVGALRAAPALGAILAALWMTRRPIRTRAGPRMLAAVAGYGVTIVVFGLSRDFALSFLALAAGGALDMVSVAVRHTMIQLRTPDAMRGRVSAVNWIFIGASNELGEFESGVTAAWWGAVPAVVAGGVGTCLVVGIWAWLFPDLRKVDELQAEGGRR